MHLSLLEGSDAAIAASLQRRGRDDVEETMTLLERIAAYQRSHFRFSARLLIDYDDWLHEQFKIPENILPTRLVAGWLAKGAVIQDQGLIFYGADNEPLASLWDLVERRHASPDVSLRQLLVERRIFASWPPIIKPPLFEAKWGPQPLALKSRHLKIAHLLNAGRTALSCEGSDLVKRAHRTLSLMNCFPFPNVGRVHFTLNGKPTGDLAEDPAVQNVLLSWMHDHIGTEPDGASAFARFLASCGNSREFSYDPEWRRKASAWNIGTVLRRGRMPPRATSEHGDGPCAFSEPSSGFESFADVVDSLRDWRARCPSAVRLDDRSSGGNRRPMAHFYVSHFRGTPLQVPRPTLGGVLTAEDFTGVFYLSGDTQARRIDDILMMVDSGEAVESILVPAATTTGENPKFLLPGDEDSRGFYCRKT